MPAIQVAVCGPRECTEKNATDGFEVGRLLAQQGATVLNGGGVGVMAAASAGAKSAGGLVIGVRPGDSTAGANPHLDAVLVTNMGEARNAILVWSADAVIVIGGSWGTLSEMALARRRPVPVVSLDGWRLLTVAGEPVPDGPIEVATAQEAVRTALDHAQHGRS